MLGAFIWKRNERMIRNVPARRPLTSVWVYEWQVSGRRQLRVPITIFFDCFLNSREVWFGESHHQMLLGGLKNVQNDEVYQIFAWVNLGWHQRRKEKKRGCCSDSSERRIWLVVEACVPASHTDLQAFCVRIQWGRGSEIWWSNKAGQIRATCHQNLFKLVWLEIAGVEPSYDIAFAREVGGKVGRVHDGCLFRPLCPSLPRTVRPQSGQATRMNGSIGVN